VLTFYTKHNRLIKSVIRHLHANISAEGITVILQEIDHDVVNVKEMTAKRLTPEGGVIHTSLPFYPVTL
jgi:hypothetical protein